MSNSNLHEAKRNKNDEFYTQLSDIENELRHYKPHFKGKSVFLNCDDPEESNFWVYFSRNFEHLGLKKLVSVHYHESRPTYKLEIIVDVDGDGRIDHRDLIKTPLKQNGDFRSEESIAILKECDIVVTNPPFSLFREYIAQLVEYDKQFLIVGNVNNATNDKEIFELVRTGKLWMGVNYNKTMEFRIPSSYEKHSRVDEDGNKYGNVPGICWFTNLDHEVRHQPVILYREYSKEDYPKYDGTDIINVDRAKDIPANYDGVMGVPITFLGKLCPEQFEIVGATNNNHEGCTSFVSYVGGKKTYSRLLIKKLR